MQYTDVRGYFTVTLGSLANGSYNYRVKGPKYLANAGTFTLAGNSHTNLEVGLMKAGDSNNDNVINIVDFNILKFVFGTGIHDPTYDDRADFTSDQVVTVIDFNLMKFNFGIQGVGPTP